MLLYLSQRRFIQEITQKLPKTFINKKAPVRRLFDPEAFHLNDKLL